MSRSLETEVAAIRIEQSELKSRVKRIQLERSEPAGLREPLGEKEIVAVLDGSNPLKG